MAKRYAETIKKEAVAQHQSGISADELCLQYGMTRSTLFLWLKQYRPVCSDQVLREQYLLEKELERLRIEN